MTWLDLRRRELTVDKSVEDELAVLLDQVVDVTENTTVDRMRLAISILANWAT